MVEPAPFRVVNPSGKSPYVLSCEHASNYIPAHYDGLGLPESELSRHIAWDIGAAAVAERLAWKIDAPLILSGYSRLLIDLNRPPGSPTSIPIVSERTEIPGNQNISAQEAKAREAAWFWPYQNALSEIIETRLAAGITTRIFSVHSFTPVFKDFQRPWHAGILYRHSTEWGEALVRSLAAPGRVVAANQPYQVNDETDYLIPVQGEARGLEAVLLEIRQDLIGDDAGAFAWADILAGILAR